MMIKGLVVNEVIMGSGCSKGKETDDDFFHKYKSFAPKPTSETNSSDKKIVKFSDQVETINSRQEN